MKTATIASLPRTQRAENLQVVLSIASDSDREMIYQLRHDVYARELGQHAAHAGERLRDPLDDWNVYLVAKIGGQIAGFISLTPPPCRCSKPDLNKEAKTSDFAGHYSIDKYVSREALPFLFDNWLYEIRLLTVVKPHRGRELATLLMYSAFRWVESHGGKRIVAIGRQEVLEMYLRCGLELLGMTVRSGAVTYELMQVTTSSLRERMKMFGGLLERLESNTVWQLDFPFRKPAPCFHGGAFFDAIGTRFNALERSREIINADVLDAWFPPAPGVLESLREHLPWLLRTSPPTACEGLTETIAQARGIAAENVLPGAGSSDLIFRAFRHWLRPASHALILDPTYGEYAHVLERVIGCTVDRLTLSRDNQYVVDLQRLEAAFADNYDLVVLVNPNSPTGRYVPRAGLEKLLRHAPAETRFWIDETYIEYAGAGIVPLSCERASSPLPCPPDDEREIVEDQTLFSQAAMASESIERFAACSENVLVCKSMSKVYALSGARVAYLCASPHQLEELRSSTPPWVVSLPAQVGAVRALEDPAYYAARYAETALLRQELAANLSRLGLDVMPGVANFILCHLPPDVPNAATIVHRCRERNLFLRDAGAMGSQLGSRALRIAVKDRSTNEKMVSLISQAMVQPL